MQNKYAPKQFLENPLIDKGNSIQSFAKRHARLLVRTNIWQRLPAWTVALLNEDDWTLRRQYAFRLYCRLVQHYGVTCPLPAEDQVVDAMWWERDVIATDQVQETENQGLARTLYIAAFTYELGMYTWHYIAEHSGRWNTRVYKLAQA